jgi:hypothetical protein
VFQLHKEEDHLVAEQVLTPEIQVALKSKELPQAKIRLDLMELTTATFLMAEPTTLISSGSLPIDLATSLLNSCLPRLELSIDSLREQLPETMLECLLVYEITLIIAVAAIMLEELAVLLEIKLLLTNLYLINLRYSSQVEPLLVPVFMIDFTEVEIETDLIMLITR